MPRITNVHARQVLDSRGDPTLQVEVRCGSGIVGRATVPAGASTGQAEAHELRDGDPNHYDGRGVLGAVANVHEHLAPEVMGLEPGEQFDIDGRMCRLDGTANKSRLGANAILGVSLAVAHAAAAAVNVPLYRHLHQLWQSLPTLSEASQVTVTPPRMPMPMTNMISGGLHAGGNLDFQDFLIMPVGADCYSEALEWIVRVSRRLGVLLQRAGYEGRLVGDEGGYGPRLAGNRQAAEFVVRAIEAAGLRPGEDVTLALDVASTHFFKDGYYHLASAGDERLSSSQMIDQLEQMVDQLPITSIEDGLAEEDWDGWQELTRRLGDRVRIVGDDLFATNPTRVWRGIDSRAANSVLVKVNQIGTLTETLQTMGLAASASFSRVVSARSGETEDTTIADLAVGTRAELIKIGSIQRSERLAKYNRLLQIEEELGPEWACR